MLSVLSRLAGRSKQNLMWRALKKPLNTELQARAPAVLPGHLLLLQRLWAALGAEKSTGRPPVSGELQNASSHFRFFFLSVNLTVFDILTRWTHKNLFASDYTRALKPYSVEILAKTTVWHHCKHLPRSPPLYPRPPSFVSSTRGRDPARPGGEVRVYTGRPSGIPEPAKHAWTTETLLPTLSEEQWQRWCVFERQECKGVKGRRRTGAYKRAIKSFQKYGKDRDNDESRKGSQQQ